VALAEEIGFADGLVGEICFKGGNRGKNQIEGQEEAEEDAQELTHEVNLDDSIKQKRVGRIKSDYKVTQRGRSRDRRRRKESSAEVVEIEVDGDGVALWRIYVDGSGARGKVFGVEVELESGAGEFATAFIRAEEIRLAGRGERPELFVAAGDLHVEIFPEVIGTRDEAVGRAGA
jgi:hypothetical protein